MGAREQSAPGIEARTPPVAEHSGGYLEIRTKKKFCFVFKLLCLVY